MSQHRGQLRSKDFWNLWIFPCINIHAWSYKVVEQVFVEENECKTVEHLYLEEIFKIPETLLLF